MKANSKKYDSTQSSYIFSALITHGLFILLIAHNLPTEMFQNSWISHIFLEA